ncbi:SMI1/KNR4 family protein [Streptomyces sp. URMC 125]|uniref:SMI1/KNR4 family protein n=1 Tax=Streptomyces sp. URMC 125 TaxID=3423419 RepID=UPI003F195D9C
MEFEQFESLLATTRAERERTLPEGFHAFDLLAASNEELAQAEQRLGVRLPDDYKKFMRRYGGGEFLFLDLLPVLSHDGAEDDLVGVNESDIESEDFIAIAPVGTGDWWGFSASGAVCRNQVDFLDHEDGQVRFAAADFFEFLARQGLRVGV